MATQKKVLSSMGIMLLAGAALAAQGTGSKPAASHAPGAQTKQALPSQSKPGENNPAMPAEREATGSVVSATASKLVISHMVKGKREEMSFTLNPETQKRGSLDAGAQAMVKFRVENGENVATLVSARQTAKHPTK